MKQLFTLLMSMVMLMTMGADRQQITNLPTVYIDTEGKTPVVSKDTYIKGTVTVVSQDEKEVCEALPMSVKGRGNSTWSMAKKPYRLKLDSKTNFMGLNAKAKNWVFLANYADKSMIRNALAFEISRAVGMEYTPSTKFVDLVFNDEYLGTYMVTDQTEVNKGRVPVEEQEETDVDEPAITGGYLLEIDGFADSEPVWFQTAKGMKVTIKYPKDDEINDAQREYITEYVRDFEDILFSPDYKDLEKGYRSMMDEVSLVNWYIACELTANSDSFWSTYIYKKRNDPLLYYGPLWDFDIAFNNDNRLGDATRKLMRDAAHNPRTWITQLWKDDTFKIAVNNRWKELLEQGIEERLLKSIAEYASLIDESQKKNYQKWPVLNYRVYQENYLYPTYEEYISELNTFVKERVAFLTESFGQSAKVVQPIEIDESAKYSILHHGGNYISELAETCRLGAEDDRALVNFVEVDDNIFAIQLPSGKYMGSYHGTNHDWDIMLYEDCDDPYAQYELSYSPKEDYMLIKNIGMNRYLGTDKNDVGGGIYTDKRGDQDLHLWKIIQETSGNTSGIAQLGNKKPSLILSDGLLISEAVDSEIVVYSVTGASVLSGKNVINTNDLSAGVYIAVMTTPNEGATTIKFIRK